jgi:hypothetical protein
LAIILSNTIVMRPVAVLILYARNARTHSDAQIAQIAASIRECGFTNPLLIDELLKLEPDELRLEGSNLSLTGFGERELAGLLYRTEGRTDPNDVPDPPTHPVTQPGDLWLLGAKVTCPNCRKIQPLERAI